MRPQTLPSPNLRRKALEEKHPTWTPLRLDERLDQCALLFGDRPFVITDERELTYAEVRDMAWRIADGLVHLGIKPGDRVGIIMANYAEFIPVKIAIARAGAVAVSLNYLYRTEELRGVLEQADVSVLITMTGFSGMDYLEMLDTIAPGWEHAATRPVKGLPSLKVVVQLPNDGRRREAALTLDELAALGSDHPGEADGGGRRSSDVADIVFTSGSTGAPKGVQLSHEGPQWSGFSSAYMRAFEDGRRILFSLPCYHLFAYTEGILSVMFVGGAVIPQLSFDAAGYLAGIEKHRASDILCVPTMTIALLEHPDATKRDLSSLFAVLSAAAPAPRWVWERARDLLGISEVTTGYGMTETGGSTAMTLPEDPLDVLSTTVGKLKEAGITGTSLPDATYTRFRVVDPDTGADVPAGTDGELFWSTPAIMSGFWRKPEETAAALDGSWLRSGDIGHVDPSGYLHLTGRSKELYKSGGELVMPKEVEEVVSRHPAVSQVYAVGVPDERWGESGCLWIIPAPGAEVEPPEIIAYCKANLARFKVPRHVFTIAARDLPTTATGKVQKFKLVELAMARLVS